jgi:hypothetical protein
LWIVGCFLGFRPIFSFSANFLSFRLIFGFAI